MGALRQEVRRDRGRSRSFPPELRTRLIAQYREHPSWSARLHYDNLEALVAAEDSLGPLPSYATVRRFLKRNGLVRKRRVRRDPSTTAVEPAYEEREVRSYESEYVNALWHADFHHGSLSVLTAAGRWVRPIAFGSVDDCSRLACHVQWYLSETAEAFVHALSQAFQKRALPRSLMTDNGAAMLAAETVEGLERLGIVHRTTLPYSPWQNGKQEVFWAQLEGRLVAMLEGQRDLTLRELNVATQIWCESEYNRRLHGELGVTPVERYVAGPDRGRDSPDSESLRLAFGTEVERRQRRSDGTVRLEGQRFEIPQRYRHLSTPTVRYARWDLSRVHLIDPGRGEPIARLYPLDRVGNADGRRRKTSEPEVEAESTAKTGEAPPLLKKMLDAHTTTGQPVSYIALDEEREPKENDQ